MGPFEGIRKASFNGCIDEDLQVVGHLGFRLQGVLRRVFSGFVV